MKKIYSFIAALFIAQYTFAQWPANYDGVMLQGFYWNSYEETQWTNLTAQADELSTYFNAIWVPNSSWCTDNNSMGYDPVYWFRHKSSFGQERDLRIMIKTYKEKGVSIIGDVVINHKKPEGKNGSWIDFVNEQAKFSKEESYDITWSGADICQNDDGGYTKQQGWAVTGADDTGDDFSGFRDLDHTSANVQKNVKLYLRYLLEVEGYEGFRLDMVKGYSPYYTKLYNEAVNPKFCVGEYWDGFSSITWWIGQTGKTSAAFDFPLKYQINKACGGDWSALSDKGMAGSPDWNRYAVTFVDNHDTYEKGSDRVAANIPAANAIILGLPGTPCIFLKHWQSYPIAIGNMILARKACGITNQSPIIEQYASNNGYVIKTQGTVGTVLVVLGNASCDTSGFKLIKNGDNYAFYVSNNVNVEGLRPGDDNPYTGEIPECVKPIEGHLYCYFQGNKDYPAPNAWVWGVDNKSFNKKQTWPGDVLTKVGQDSDQHDIYLWDAGEVGSELPTGIVFSTGTGSPQTSDFVFHNGGYYDASGYLTTPTGIAPVRYTSTTTAGKTYNLSGQLVTDGYRGIVIRNGKKMVIK